MAAAASVSDTAQPGTAADMHEAQEAASNSQDTAREAQALVAEAANQQREGDAVATRQGLVRGLPSHLPICTWQYVMPTDTC
jgi:hypothetical protein